ncbi:hypothetical protein U1Q18_039231 [Sarracenia purpurea var. burkii]
MTIQSPPVLSSTSQPFNRILPIPAPSNNFNNSTSHNTDTSNSHTSNFVPSTSVTFIISGANSLSTVISHSLPAILLSIPILPYPPTHSTPTLNSQPMLTRFKTKHLTCLSLSTAPPYPSSPKQNNSSPPQSQTKHTHSSPQNTPKQFFSIAPQNKTPQTNSSPQLNPQQTDSKTASLVTTPPSPASLSTAEPKIVHEALSSPQCTAAM